MTTSVILAAAEQAGGFSWRTLLIFVGGAAMLAFFSSIGIIARMRDRRNEEQKNVERARPAQRTAEQPDDPRGQPDR